MLRASCAPRPTLHVLLPFSGPRNLSSLDSDTGLPCLWLPVGFGQWEVEAEDWKEQEERGGIYFLLHFFPASFRE